MTSAAFTKTVEPRSPLPASARHSVHPGSRWIDNINAVLRIAAFVAVLGAVVCAVHSMIETGLQRISTSSFGVTNRMVKGAINADIVVSGSSRALVHYDPRVIQSITGLSVFNIGRNGSQSDLQLAVLKTYLRHNAKPKLVIHNLDLYSFVTSHEIYDPAQYLPYLGEQPLYAAVRNVYPDAWKWKYLPLYGYVVADMRFTWLLGLQRCFGVEPTEDHINGFAPRPWAWTGEFEAFRRDNPNGVATPIEPAGVRVMEELMSLCRAEKIPLLLIYSPEYFEVQSLQTNRAQIFAQFAVLSARYQVPLWDFSNSGLAKSRAYFYNSQHLNSDGAAAFSEEVARRLTVSGLIQTSDSSAR